MQGEARYSSQRMAEVLAFRDKVLQSRDAVELLANKWRITVLHLLRNGALRTGELQSAITDVSAKVLTQSLRGMERDGLLDRTVQSVVPPHVEYSLTSMGASLIKPLQELCHWAKAHAHERDQARSRFDAGEAKPRAHRKSAIVRATAVAAKLTGTNEARRFAATKRN